MIEITADTIAAAMAEPTLTKRFVMSCEFVVKHGGVDGYERNEQLAQFMTRLRTSALFAAHQTSWPRPEAVVRAEVSIVAHGKHCGPKTMAQMATFFGKHLYAGVQAVTMAAPTIVKTGVPRLEITVRAIEIVEPENVADRAARLAREANPPALRADGTLEGELRDWERPAFVTDQGVAEVDPLAERLDRMENAAQIPTPEDDMDPPSILNAEDPDAVIKRWGPILSHATPGGGGGSSNKGAKAKPKATDRRGRYIALTQDDGTTRPLLVAGRVSEIAKTALHAQEESAGEIFEVIGQLLSAGVPMSTFTDMLKTNDSAEAA